MAAWRGECVVFECPNRAAEGTTVCTDHKQKLIQTIALLDKFIWNQKTRGEQARMF